MANPQTIHGLSFAAMAIAFSSASWAARNSSEFSYKNFVVNRETADNARSAMRTAVIESGVICAGMAGMAYIATGSTLWAAVTFIAGFLITLLYYATFDRLIREKGY